MYRKLLTFDLSKVNIKILVLQEMFANETSLLHNIVFMYKIFTRAHNRLPVVMRIVYCDIIIHRHIGLYELALLININIIVFSNK